MAYMSHHEPFLESLKKVPRTFFARFPCLGQDVANVKSWNQIPSPMAGKPGVGNAFQGKLCSTQMVFLRTPHFFLGDLDENFTVPSGKLT
jgi:hypothetical protein